MSLWLQLVFGYLFLGVVFATYVFFVLSTDRDTFLKQNKPYLNKDELDDYDNVKQSFDKRNKYLSFGYYVLISPLFVVYLLLTSIYDVIKSKKQK